MSIMKMWGVRKQREDSLTASEVGRLKALCHLWRLSARAATKITVLRMHLMGITAQMLCLATALQVCNRSCDCAFLCSLPLLSLSFLSLWYPSRAFRHQPECLSPLSRLFLSFYSFRQTFGKKRRHVSRICKIVPNNSAFRYKAVCLITVLVYPFSVKILETEIYARLF